MTRVLLISILFIDNSAGATIILDHANLSRDEVSKIIFDQYQGSVNNVDFVELDSHTLARIGKIAKDRGLI